MKYVRYVFGLLYVLAGLAKAFPSVEDAPQLLADAALANADSVLGPASQWLAEHAGLVTAAVGIALFSSGICYLLNRLIVLATIGQLVMIACFITILFRTTPMIVLIDVPFIIVAILLCADALRNRATRVVPLPAQGRSETGEFESRPGSADV
jgi:hypothetical protein